MDYQEVKKYRFRVYRWVISVVTGNYLILIIFILVYEEHFPVLLHLKCCLRLNCDLNPVPILLFYHF